MPLQHSPDPAGPVWAQECSADYLIFYSSREEGGKLWCPDCRDVETLVKETFEPVTAPTAAIVYVGQRPEWKTPSNPFRSHPFDVQSIPTIIRKRDGARLVEGEITEQLASFIE